MRLTKTIMMIFASLMLTMLAVPKPHNHQHQFSRILCLLVHRILYKNGTNYIRHNYDVLSKDAYPTRYSRPRLPWRRADRTRIRAHGSTSSIRAASGYGFAPSASRLTSAKFGLRWKTV